MDVGFKLYASRSSQNLCSRPYCLGVSDSDSPSAHSLTTPKINSRLCTFHLARLIRLSTLVRCPSLALIKFTRASLLNARLKHCLDPDAYFIYLDLSEPLKFFLTWSEMLTGCNINTRDSTFDLRGSLTRILIFYRLPSVLIESCHAF